MVYSNWCHFLSYVALAKGLKKRRGLGLLVISVASFVALPVCRLGFHFECIQLLTVWSILQPISTIIHLAFFILWVSLPISSSAVFALLSPIASSFLHSSFLSSISSHVPLFPPLFWFQPCFFFLFLHSTSAYALLALALPDKYLSCGDF